MTTMMSAMKEKTIKKNKHTCNQNNNNNNNRRQKSFSKQKINNTNNNNNSCSTCELNRLLIRRNQILKESREVEEEEEEGDLKRFDKEIYEFSNLILKILSTITEKYNKSLNDINNSINNGVSDSKQLSLFVENKKSNYNNGRKRDVLPKFPQLVIYIIINYESRRNEDTVKKENNKRKGKYIYYSKPTKYLA